jgi:hypothetical protein
VSAGESTPEVETNLRPLVVDDAVVGGVEDLSAMHDLVFAEHVAEHTIEPRREGLKGVAGALVAAFVWNSTRMQPRRSKA